jgi:hypothetical protein
MSAIYDKDRHSRSSSKTEVPDLEKGETEPEEEVEDVVAEEKVRFSNLAYESFN